jgi:hypothetical protein
MTMYVFACLEGRVLSLKELSRIDPLWISPYLLAHTQTGLLQIHHLLPFSILITFLMDKQEDGQQIRGQIVELIKDHESKVEENPTRIKLRVSVNEDKAEEIITYKKMLEYIAKDEDSDINWKFRRIVSHEYKGSQCNGLIKWENEENTNDPLKIIAADDPVSCAIYACEINLLDQPGWKMFEHIAK